MAVAASSLLLFLGSSAISEAPFVAVLSDDADTDTFESSVLLLSRGDSGRSADGARFCSDLPGEDSMLVIDEDSLA